MVLNGTGAGNHRWHPRLWAQFCSKPASYWLQQNWDPGNFWRVLSWHVHIVISLAGQCGECEEELKSSGYCSIAECYSLWYNGVGAQLGRLRLSPAMVMATGVSQARWRLVSCKPEWKVIQCTGCRHRLASMQQVPSLIGLATCCCLNWLRR